MKEEERGEETGLERGKGGVRYCGSRKEVKIQYMRLVREGKARKETEGRLRE